MCRWVCKITTSEELLRRAHGREQGILQIPDAPARAVLKTHAAAAKGHHCSPKPLEVKSPMKGILRSAQEVLEQTSSSHPSPRDQFNPAAAAKAGILTTKIPCGAGAPESRFPDPGEVLAVAQLQPSTHDLIGIVWDSDLPAPQKTKLVANKYLVLEKAR